MAAKAPESTASVDRIVKNDKRDFKKSAFLASLLLTGTAAVFRVAGNMIGNYFYNFAISRTDHSSPKKNLDPAVSKRNIPSLIQQRLDERKVAEKKFIADFPPTQLHRESHDHLQLHALRFVTHPDSHRWAILLHGYMNDASYMFYYASVYAKHGFNILTPDLRGSGASEGDYIGMGWDDRRDVVGWINDVVARDPEARIIVFGVSMGGATAMMTAGEPLPENVACIVEDCGYSSVADEFSYELRNLYHLPSFPILRLADKVTKARAGYSIYDASAVEQLKKTRLPVLFIHGDKDTFVPTEMVYKVYAAAAAEKELLIIKNATHAASSIVDPDRYFSTVFRFIDNYLQA